MLWAIRKFQPDVIVNRFDHRSAGTTHGHHSISNAECRKFCLSKRSTIFPEQLQFVQPWQVKRQFFYMVVLRYYGKI
jgi:hypothetical protein